MTADDLGAIVGFLLTLAVLSYLLGDNPVYRVAIHVFVGAAAGYAAIIVTSNILYPQLIAPIIPLIPSVLLGQSIPPDQLMSILIPLVGAWIVGLLLLMKAAPSTQRLGSFGTAFMIGVGVAVAVGGAVMGTILPQMSATFLSATVIADLATTPPARLGAAAEQAVNAWIIMGGTLLTLGFFYYGARAKPGGVVEQSVFIKIIAIFGRIFIGITFGVMYAGALAASLALFADSLLAAGSTIEKILAILFGS